MPSTVRLRPSVLDARERVRENLTEIRRLHSSGMASVQVCARLSSAVDLVLIRLFEAALADLPSAAADALRGRVAMVAIGGYGRRQLAPYSDVDLMILYVGKLDEGIRSFTARITQDLYDAGLQPGHSLRDPNEAVRLARSDAVICTSLIESRLIVGAQKLFEAFRTAYVQMVSRRHKILCREFIQARRAERHKFGETVFLLEPNIKRSPGGLRDIHLLRWLWFAKTGESDLLRLLHKGAISNFDHRRLMSSQSFLLQVRNEMHFGAGSASDVLNRAEQVRIAEALGVHARPGLLPVEQLMRDYFRHTSHVSFLATRMCDLVSPPPVVARMLEPMLSQSLSSDYRLGSREISATGLGSTKLQQRLGEAVRLVDLARLYEKRIAQETWYHVYRSAPGYSTELDDNTRQRFRDMLANPHNLGDALRRMHELGILEKIIPDFSHARCLLQFNRYHKYTVDEHCIRSVGEATRLGERDDLIGDVYRRLKPKWLLHLALLLHDLGKGHTEDHSKLGEQIARQIGLRLDFADEETEVVAELVRDHLDMTHAALWRDTSDPRMVRQFAEKAGTAERLDMRLLLTCADLAAVGPGVFNNWKVGVLSDFYRRVRALLVEDDQEERPDRRAKAREDVAKQLLPEEQSDPWFQRYLRALPDTFLSTRPAADAAEFLRQLRRLSPREAMATGRYLPDARVVEFTAGVCEGTGRGIFSAMAGVLSSRGMSILTAETHIFGEDFLLLRYEAIDGQSNGPTSDARLDEIERALVDSIGSDEPPVFRPIWGAAASEASSSLTNLPVEVRLDTELSHDCLIVEVFAFDRLGLLYELARAVHELGLNIRFAKIGTHLDQVVDVFYVTERDGGKPSGEQRLREIRSRLEAIIA